jgi:hypothetical protein
MLLPHIGETPGSIHRARKSTVSRSACAAVIVLARTRAASPEVPCWRRFQSSIASSMVSDWWIASTGPSASVFRCRSVTMVAISMM